MYDSIDWAMTVLRGVAGVIMLAHGIKHARGRAKTAAGGQSPWPRFRG